MDVREKLEVIAHLGDHITYKEDIGICYDGALAKVIEDAYMELKNGVMVQEWYSANNPPKKDGTYLVQTNTGTITTARFYAFKSFPATKYLPACHRSASWQSNRNVVKWTYLPQLPKGE